MEPLVIQINFWTYRRSNKNKVPDKWGKTIREWLVDAKWTLTWYAHYKSRTRKNCWNQILTGEEKKDQEKDTNEFPHVHPKLQLFFFLSSFLVQPCQKNLFWCRWSSPYITYRLAKIIIMERLDIGGKIWYAYIFIPKYLIFLLFVVTCSIYPLMPLDARINLYQNISFSFYLG